MERRRSSLVRALVATVLVATSGVLPSFLTGALGVQLRAELGFGEAALGAVIGASFLGAAACSALFGSFVERLGPVRAMRASSAVSASSMLATALFARSFVSLTATLMIGGLANAMSQPATNLYIASTMPPHRHGLAFAIKQSSIPGATLLGGLAVPLVALTVGWRWAFVGGAVLAVVGARVVARPETGRRRSLAPPARRDQPLGTLAVLGAAVGFGAFAASSLGSFVTSALAEAGFAEGAAGALAAAGSALVIVTRLSLGAHADRSARPPFRLVGGMLLVGSAGFAVMSAMSPAALVVGGVAAYVCGWGWPGLVNLAVARANPSAPAAASGVTQTGTYLGVAVGPFLFGVVVEGSGYSAAWWMAGGAALAAAGFLTVGARLSGPARRPTTVLLHE